MFDPLPPSSGSVKWLGTGVGSGERAHRAGKEERHPEERQVGVGTSGVKKTGAGSFYYDPRILQGQRKRRKQRKVS